MSLDLLTEPEAAAALGCAETTVRELARKGELPALQFGNGGWVFPVEALSQRLNELAIQQAAERRKPAVMSGVLVNVNACGKPRRSPPALPSLPAAAGDS